MRNQKVERSAIRSDASKASRNVNTMLRLPRSLYEHAKRHAARNHRDSVNDLIVDALEAYVTAADGNSIDEAFRGMADDERYQREALRIVEEFGG